MFHLSPSFGLLLLAYAVSALLCRRMISVAVLDTPGHRSSHTIPTPKGGGIGVMGAFLLLFFPMRHVCGLEAFTPDSMAIWVAAALLAAVSWLDDVYQWSPLIKLGAQCLSAVLVTAATLPVGTFDSTMTALFAGFCAVIWIVFVTNAVNFMDGLNGLVSGTLCLVFLCLALPFWPSDTPELRLIAALLSFGLLAFLPLNFPHARIFLGDVGSQPCGLLVAASALLLATPDFAPTMPDFHAALLVPCLTAGLLYDVGFTLVRRGCAGEKLLQAHRGHLYQIAFRSGVPMPAITLLHWAFVLWGAGTYALLCLRPEAATALTIFCVALPQLLWTAFVIRRASRHPVGKW
ncbi:MraY family glycosyltransferase [Acetobacter conturbans]|uniref:UDP-phosphate alpha-N-acetylglucosaminephosphotransferase n=1 Tax=Acetobacter conturbans TaxID=1737472 RepID=A0ABX0JY82_9PROT|nr:UDP-phosphate alpha-N-acetylglucosaminephosphotransferase [Acetobacter conturbans]NHN87837.1 UDP-phosphate alpha-N-acetylglucosaminephosphotransferase [Acetobacter conturbans]